MRLSCFAALALGCRATLTLEVPPRDDAGGARASPMPIDAASASTLTDALHADEGAAPADVPGPCQTGHIRCGRECVNLRSDPQNCGACGNACPQDPRREPGGRWRCVEHDGVATCGNRIRAIALGARHLCIVRWQGEVQCWGANDRGQLGDESTTPRATPVFVAGLNGVTMSTLAVGGEHTCGGEVNGINTYCWGRNDHGQLGIGFSGSDSFTSLRAEVRALSAVTSLSTGDAHSCAVGAGHNLWCWGLNRLGQLGDGTINDQPTPVAVSRASGLSGVFEVACGESHTCALGDGGAAWCWGEDNGRLGAGLGRGMSVVPLRVRALPAEAQQIVTGAGHSCARHLRGFSYCWGNNAYGQLGDRTWVSRDEATPVADLQGLKWLYASASSSHTCAVSAESRIYCWGYNERGQLGDGTRINRNRPVAARFDPALRFDRVVLGGSTTCGLTTARDEVWCWGDIDWLEPTAAAGVPATAPTRLTVVP